MICSLLHHNPHSRCFGAAVGFSVSERIILCFFLRSAVGCCSNNDSKAIRRRKRRRKASSSSPARTSVPTHTCEYLLIPRQFASARHFSVRARVTRIIKQPSFRSNKKISLTIGWNDCALTSSFSSSSKLELSDFRTGFFVRRRSVL